MISDNLIGNEKGSRMKDMEQQYSWSSRSIKRNKYNDTNQIMLLL